MIDNKWGYCVKRLIYLSMLKRKSNNPNYVNLNKGFTMVKLMTELDKDLG